MKIEITILLGLNCNFRCSHCLNDSRPGFKDYDITENERNKVIAEIENNESVTSISFAGGEPLLYMNEIEYIIENLKEKIKNRVLHFSITTNGSLIQQNAERLKSLKVDSALISYDIPHSAFFKKDELSRTLTLAKALFSKVELTTTFENIASESPISEIAILHDVKVNFNRAIQSGRFKSSVKQNVPSGFETIPCPNLESSLADRLKLVYFSPYGFSFCCGPLLFDNLKDSSAIFFDSIESLFQSPRYQLQKKLSETKVKCNSKTACENCFSTMVDPVFKKFSSFFTSTKLWENSIPLLDISSSELIKLEDFFRLRRIGFSTPSSFKNIPEATPFSQEGLVIDFCNKASPEDREEISNFIIDSFYRPHNLYFNDKDIEVFQSQLPLFFDLPFHFVRHKLNNKTVGILMLALIEGHPFYKKSVWHIGYWGIDKCIEDRTTRQSIKNEWQKFLGSLSTQHQISVIIDQFNAPALKMAGSFGMDISTLRLDPRST